MSGTSSIVTLLQPDNIDDPLTNILQAGARQFLRQPVEIEVEAFLATVKDLKLVDWCARVVRDGYGPTRSGRDRNGRGRAGEDWRPRGGWWRRTDPLQFGDPAAVGAADQQPGCAVAGAVPRRAISRRR
jgi:hypothetical protein